MDWLRDLESSIAKPFSKSQEVMAPGSETKAVKKGLDGQLG